MENLATTTQQAPSDALVYTYALTIQQQLEHGLVVLAGGREFSQRTILQACCGEPAFREAEQVFRADNSPEDDKLCAAEVLSGIYAQHLLAQSLAAAQCLARYFQ